MQDFISKFRTVAGKYPKNTAISTDGGKNITYLELYESAQRVASFLRAKKVKRGDVVAISLEKSAEYVMSILGIWMAGAAFLPLPPSLPKDRRRFIIDEVSPKVILSDDDVRRALKHKTDGVPNAEVGAGDLAYIIYTSGSTGRPKGVMINHAGIVNLL